jgi:DNA ligase-1
MQVARETAIAKNVGRANATTPEQQAVQQAMSDYTTKLTRKGYTEDLTSASSGENAGAGGIRPMLAKNFEDYADRLSGRYVYVQPKLDGIRCIAVVESDKRVTLWSREQKPIVAVPRVAEALVRMKWPVGTVLDGELYNHNLREDFEQIVSAVRKKEPAPAKQQELIQYHVYDVARMPDGKPADFNQRWGCLLDNFRRVSPIDLGRTDGARWIGYWGDEVKGIAEIPEAGFERTVFMVATRGMDVDAELVKDTLFAYQNLGYEGIMVRVDDINGGRYEEGKRSVSLLKYKTFQDAEFPIIGVEEGVGKMAGLAIFVCRAPNGETFRCKMEGELEGLRKYIQDESAWRGKSLTVKFFSYTAKGLPRFPVGKAVRDYE